MRCPLIHLKGLYSFTPPEPRRPPGLPAIICSARAARYAAIELKSFHVLFWGFSNVDMFTNSFWDLSSEKRFCVCVCVRGCGLCVCVYTKLWIWMWKYEFLFFKVGRSDTTFSLELAMIIFWSLFYLLKGELPHRFKPSPSCPLDWWNLACLLQLFTLFHISDYIFGNNERWIESFDSQFSIKKFHLTNPLSNGANALSKMILKTFFFKQLKISPYYDHTSLFKFPQHVVQN